MSYPPLWMWLVAVALTLAGLGLSGSLRVVKLIERLPVWLCALLVLVGLVGIWYLLNTQFGGQVIQVHVP